MKLFSKSTLLISTLSLTEIWEELGYSTTFNWISFFFHHWEKKRKQKLAELELPYVSLQGMKELHCKLGIREWWARSLRETSKIHDNCYEQCWRRNPLNNLQSLSVWATCCPLSPICHCNSLLAVILYVLNFITPVFLKHPLLQQAIYSPTFRIWEMFLWLLHS